MLVTDKQGQEKNLEKMANTARDDQEKTKVLCKTYLL